MSEQKKPKIDLKARLGKKTVAAPTGPAIPPPVGIPKPPAMGGGGMGMPMRSSAPPPAQARLDVSNPYAAVEAQQAYRPPEPQAIKVEMSEEVVAQQAKTRRRMFFVALVISGITGAMGFTFGGSVERGKGADAALQGAKELIKEVEASDKVADTLNEVMVKAGERLGKGEYPAEEVTKLGEINIPFDGGHLTDKSIGRFKRDLVVQLINYSNTAQRANEQKEKIQNVLAGAKAGITELLAMKTDPKVHWGVYVQGGPSGPWASMQMLPAAFTVKTTEQQKEWPAEFPIKDGNQTVNLKRYKSGDPVSDPPQLIPVNPLTETMVCPSSVIVRLRQELGEMQTVLKGDNTPGQEKTGLLQMGETIVQSLKKIGSG
jgi:hypothetical protein